MSTSSSHRGLIDGEEDRKREREKERQKERQREREKERKGIEKKRKSRASKKLESVPAKNECSTRFVAKGVFFVKMWSKLLP